MLGNPRGLRRGSLIGTEAYADGLPDNQAKWLKDVGSKFKGAKIRYSTESTPPSVVLNQIKKEFTDPTGIEVEVEIVPLEQVLAKATQDVQGQLGSYDLYYLDQSWISMFQPDCIDPVAYYKDKPELAMPDFDWDDFSKPLVKNVAQVEGQWMGIPFDIPIFTLMYRKDILEKHKIAVPTTYEDFLAAARQISEAEKAQRNLRHRLAGEVGPLFAGMRLRARPCGAMAARSSARTRNSRAMTSRALPDSKWYQELLKDVAAELDGIDLGWPVRDDAFGSGGAGAELGRVLPGPRRRRLQGQGSVGAGRSR